MRKESYFAVGCQNNQHVCARITAAEPNIFATRTRNYHVVNARISFQRMSLRHRSAFAARFVRLRSTTAVSVTFWMHRDSGSDRRCRCGHPHTAHLHYRRGSECSLCSGCSRYRPVGTLVTRIIDLLTKRSRRR